MLTNPSIWEIILFIVLNSLLAYRINDYLKTQVEIKLSLLISLIIIFHPFSIINLFFSNKFQLIIGNILFIEHLINDEKKDLLKSSLFAIIASVFNLILFPISIYYFFKNIKNLKKYRIPILVTFGIIFLYLFILRNPINFQFTSFLTTYFSNLLVPRVVTIFNYGLSSNNLNYAFFFLFILLVLILFYRRLRKITPLGIYFLLCLPMIFFSNWYNYEYDFEGYLFNPISLFPSLLFTVVFLSQLGKKILSSIFLISTIAASCYWLAQAPSASSLIQSSHNNLTINSNIDHYEISKLKIITLKKENKKKEALEYIEEISLQSQNPLLIQERLKEFLK